MQESKKCNLNYQLLFQIQSNFMHLNKRQWLESLDFSIIKDELFSYFIQACQNKILKEYQVLTDDDDYCCSYTATYFALKQINVLNVGTFIHATEDLFEHCLKPVSHITPEQCIKESTSFQVDTNEKDDGDTKDKNVKNTDLCEYGVLKTNFRYNEKDDINTLKSLSNESTFIGYCKT
ncbi:hypothetical protein EDEG_03105 [Edhazardia aedis USNM 41457]|uniref:Uncharacterized protein n=1 Tax=Edhazardia aedis (strain USNM 41457) TaxID=1003232 RepID=J9DIP7_EDHAE|nr:hypothetical protein EDEG_03105 [Edhazardia aedis USNM 41457]|eukprot:EJW02485.1 hypothetical protein EDEG_03105 [Edhazardia aedis USNM 41457]